MKHRFLICSVIVLCAISAANGQSNQPEGTQKIVLDFEGSKAFSKQELLEVANDCLARNPDHRDVNRNNVIEYCLHLVTITLKAKGHLQAELGEPRNEETENGLITVVSVTDGPLYRVGKIEINGPKMFSASHLRELLDLKAGDIANGERLGDWLFESVKKLYDDLGYLNYASEVEPKFHISDGGHEGVVDFMVTVDEGQRFTVRRILFEGNANTSDQMIRNVLPIREGDFFSQSLYEESIKNLNKLGLFQEIDAVKDVDIKSIKPDSEAPQLDLIIHLKEKALTESDFTQSNASFPRPLRR